MEPLVAVYEELGRVICHSCAWSIDFTEPLKGENLAVIHRCSPEDLERAEKRLREVEAMWERAANE